MFRIAAKLCCSSWQAYCTFIVVVEEALLGIWFSEDIFPVAQLSHGLLGKIQGSLTLNLVQGTLRSSYPCLLMHAPLRSFGVPVHAVVGSQEL